MSPDELKASARRIADELLTQGDLAVAGELFAPDCRHHAPRPIGPGALGVQRWVAALRYVFPDLHAIVEDAVAEGTQVAQRLTLSGRQAAAFDGVSARGRRATWPVIEMLRIGHDGRFAEHWCAWDELDLLQKLDPVRATEQDEP